MYSFQMLMYLLFFCDLIIPAYFHRDDAVARLFEKFTMILALKNSQNLAGCCLQCSKNASATVSVKTIAFHLHQWHFETITVMKHS